MIFLYIILTLTCVIKKLNTSDLLAIVEEIYISKQFECYWYTAGTFDIVVVTFIQLASRNYLFSQW